MTSIYSNQSVPNLPPSSITKEAGPIPITNNNKPEPDSLSDRIALVSTKLSALKSAANALDPSKMSIFGDKDVIYFDNPTERYDKALDELNEEFSNFIDILETVFERIDDLKKGEIPFNMEQEISTLNKLNQDFNSFINTHLGNKTISENLLYASASLNHIFVQTLGVQSHLLRSQQATEKLYSFQEKVTKIFEYENLLGNQIIEQIEAKLKNLSPETHSSLSEDLNKSLSLASFFRDIYKEMGRQIKKDMVNKPAHASFASAAAIGSAATAGLQTIIQQIAKSDSLKGKTDSAQEVYLTPNTVFKMKGPKSKEPYAFDLNIVGDNEERRIRELRKLKGADSGMVEGYNTSLKGNINREFNFNQLNDRNRYQNPLNLTSSKYNSLAKKMEPEQAQKLQSFIKTKEKWQNQSLVILDQGERRDISFTDFCRQRAKDPDFGKNAIIYKQNDEKIGVTVNGNQREMLYGEFIQQFDELAQDPNITTSSLGSANTFTVEDPSFQNDVSIMSEFLFKPKAIKPILQDENQRRKFEVSESTKWYDSIQVEKMKAKIKEENLANHLVKTESEIEREAIDRLSVPFSTLMENYLEGKIGKSNNEISYFKPLNRINISKDLPIFTNEQLYQMNEEQLKQLTLNTLSVQSSYLQEALNVNWEVSDMALTKEVTTDAGIITQEVQSAQLKNFLEEMILFDEIKNSPIVRERILDRMTQSSIYDAISTAELQLLDLHGNNFGLSPVPNEAYNKWKNVKLTYQCLNESGDRVFKQNVPFKELMIDYINDSVPTNLPIFYTQKGNLRSVVLDQPQFYGELVNELHTALNTEWTLNLFDLDRSISESNNFVRYVLGNESGEEEIYESIAFRSNLLVSYWRDKPLEPEMIDRLLNDSRTSDVNMQKWIDKEDTPLYQQLNQYSLWHENNYILQSFINIYTIDNLMRINEFKKFSVESVTDLFVNDLATSNNENHLHLWQVLEQIISFDLSLKRSTVGSDVHVADFAKDFNISVETLKMFNPNLQETELIPQGTVVKYPGEIKKIDLTSNTPEAIQEKMKIARQLFPRLTFDQQKALMERQEARTTYLQAFKDLKEGNDEDLLSKLNAFVELKSCPFSTEHKRNLSKYLSEDLSLAELRHTKDRFLEWAHPTYLNLIKAMYPLAADLEKIGKIAYGDDSWTLAFEYEKGHSLNKALIQAEINASNDTDKLFVSEFKNKIDEMRKNNDFAEYFY